MTIHLRADQVVSRPRPDVPRDRPRPGPRRGPVERRARPRAAARSRSRCSRASRSLGPILFRDQSILVYVGYLLVPLAWFWINRTRPGLHLRAVGEAPGRGRRPGHRRLPAALRLRVRRRRAGGPRRGDDHARDLARLVRRPDDERPRLDRGRARDLRPVEPDPGGVRRLPVRGDLAVHPRRPGRRHVPRRRRTRSCPAGRRRSSWDAAVPVRDRRRGHRVARGATGSGSARRRRSGRRTSGASAGSSESSGAGRSRPVAVAAVSTRPSSRTSRPWSSIWTKPLVSNSSWRAPGPWPRPPRRPTSSARTR